MHAEAVRTEAGGEAAELWLSAVKCVVGFQKKGNKGNVATDY